MTILEPNISGINTFDTSGQLGNITISNIGYPGNTGPSFTVSSESNTPNFTVSGTINNPTYNLVYNNHGDIVIIHGITHKVYITGNTCFLSNRSGMGNDYIFDKLGIKDKYAFCNVQHRSGSFPVHNSIESLNITIQKLLSYGVADNTFYKSLMYDE